MVSILKRARKLKSLLAIRLGPGAAVLPPDVKRIHMDFAARINDGHFGPRKFWRLYLPRLKFHNPAVSMTINRTTDQAGPATMSIFYATPSADADTSSSTSSPAPTSSTSGDKAPSDHTPFERVQTVNMKHKHESEILAKLMELTKAVPVEATAEELEELRELEEQAAQGERDARRMEQINAQQKRREVMLAQARGDMAQQAQMG
ncbi:MAG: hypothetical protein M1819_002799 [Sarea resinae]|nr:MAG: hypothetical protein M1819_002799 [Sarea resinae]